MKRRPRLAEKAHNEKLESRSGAGGEPGGEQRALVQHRGRQAGIADGREENDATDHCGDRERVLPKKSRLLPQISTESFNI